MKGPTQSRWGLGKTQGQWGPWDSSRAVFCVLLFRPKSVEPKKRFRSSRYQVRSGDVWPHSQFRGSFPQGPGEDMLRTSPPPLFDLLGLPTNQSQPGARGHDSPWPWSTEVSLLKAEDPEGQMGSLQHPNSKRILGTHEQKEKRKTF